MAKGKFKLSAASKANLYDKYESKEIAAKRDPMTPSQWMGGGAEKYLEDKAAVKKTVPTVKKTVPKQERTAVKAVKKVLKKAAPKTESAIERNLRLKREALGLSN